MGSFTKAVQQFSCSVVSDSATPQTAAHQASHSIPNSRSLLKLMSIESVMPSSHLILCRSLLLLLLKLCLPKEQSWRSFKLRVCAIRERT